MDDLEFRRRIMSDPKARDKEILQAITSDQGNAKFAEDVLNLDARIEQAMRIDVPENLADKILFKQPGENKVVRPSFARRYFALAASVAFAAGVLVGQMNWTPQIVPAAQASLADIAMQHVLDERHFVAPIDESATARQLNIKLLPFGLRFTEGFPHHIFYLNHCGFGDRVALHMVFESEQGRITLFITQIASEKPVNFSENNMSGTIMPVGRASMILVAENGEDVSAVAAQLAEIIQPLS